MNESHVDMTLFRGMRREAALLAAAVAEGRRRRGEGAESGGGGGDDPYGDDGVGSVDYGAAATASGARTGAGAGAAVELGEEDGDMLRAARTSHSLPM